MGLMIHSLGEIPIGTEKDYYLYLLDYGWKEPIRDALVENFEKMADMASRSNSVVFQGTVGHHFSDEVLSWHSINGVEGEKILPAILITTKHPREFKELGRHCRSSYDDKLLLIPIRELCTTATDVINLVEKIFHDISAKKALPDFALAKEVSGGNKSSLVDMLILQPNISGIGVDLKKVIGFFNKK